MCISNKTIEQLTVFIYILDLISLYTVLFMETTLFCKTLKPVDVNIKKLDPRLLNNQYFT